jgi:hypothetical protein
VTDVDVFLFGEGLDSDAAFMARVRQVLVVAAAPYGCDDGAWVLSRTANGITLTCHAVFEEDRRGQARRRDDVRRVEVPPLVLQVILRRNPHGVAQVLSGFDLDASAVAWVPSDAACPLVALPRFLGALRRGANVVNTGRMSSTYEARLATNGVVMTVLVAPAQRAWQRSAHGSAARMAAQRAWRGSAAHCPRTSSRTRASGSRVTYRSRVRLIQPMDTSSS